MRVPKINSLLRGITNEIMKSVYDQLQICDMTVLLTVSVFADTSAWTLSFVFIIIVLIVQPLDQHFHWHGVIKWRNLGLRHGSVCALRNWSASIRRGLRGDEFVKDYRYENENDEKELAKARMQRRFTEFPKDGPVVIQSFDNDHPPGTENYEQS